MRLLAALLALTAAQAQDGAAHDEWLHYGGTQFAWRYSALDQINTSNVKKLVPVWSFQTGDYDYGFQATPIESGGALYFPTARSQVFALDAVSGRVLWHYKYPLPRRPYSYINNRGVAVQDGKVFLGTYDNYLIALDQKTGQEVWKVAVDDAIQCACNFDAAPLIVKDKVIVGGTGGDQAHRGYLTAFYLKTGRLAWRFYTIPGPGEPGHETWKSDSWRYGGGATWMTGSFDPDLNLVYWGVGNAASDLYAGDRDTGQGSAKVNLYTASVVALDADTGKLKWYYQEIPKDMWDYDAAYECVLMDREFRGRMRKLLVHLNKSGDVFVLDRVTGEFLTAFPYVEHHNWITGITEDGKLLGRREPVEGKNTFVCPSASGGKSWNQVAYSPRTGWVYTPSLEFCNDLIARRQEPEEGRFFIGGNWFLKPPPDGPAYSHIDAYDPVTGKRQWTWRYKYMLFASILATAGDLIFSGDPEGTFFALDARSGNKLWSYQTGNGHRAGPITYRVNGRQYIAAPSGWGAGITGLMTTVWPETAQFVKGSMLTVFALPEETR
ncbi:MAG TPA: PQQ-dependent dehydrogenase, methanol/ethanol family [Bryobacteraceae bacterium]|nr:PQQ-dependent dehydrogenase, methanol/ethanol family [Bryobacteraceae bacterium]